MGMARLVGHLVSRWWPGHVGVDSRDVRMGARMCREVASWVSELKLGEMTRATFQMLTGAAGVVRWFRAVRDGTGRWCVGDGV